MVTRQQSRPEPADMTERLAQLLLQKCGMRPIAVSDLNKIVKYQDRGKPDIVKQVFQKAVDLGFCAASGAPLSAYVGGRGRSAPMLIPTWHTSSDDAVRSRAAQWGLVDLGVKPQSEDRPAQQENTPALRHRY